AVPGGETTEHVHLVGAYHHAAVAVRDGEAGYRARLIGPDRVENLLHGGLRDVGLAGRYSAVAEIGTVLWSSPPAGSTNSTSTAPASFGCTKLIRESAVPRFGDSYRRRTPRERSAAQAASMSSTVYATCCTPGPWRSRNFAMVDSGESG